MSRPVRLPILPLLLLSLLLLGLQASRLPEATLGLLPMNERLASSSLAGGDFRSFWAQAHLAAQGHAEQAYDVRALSVQPPLAGLGERMTVRPALYPPFTILLLEPLGRLDFAQAWLVYSWGGLLLLAASVAVVFRRQLWFVPLTLGYGGIWVALTFGQNTLFLTALYVLVAGAMARRPLVAGIALGLAGFKPHLGLLVPVMLLVRRHWGAIFFAGVMLAALIAASWLRYGAEAWHAYEQTALAPLQRLRAFNQISADHMISLYAGLRQLGVPDLPALAAQGGLALLALLGVVQVGRHSHDPQLPLAAAITGGLLAVPHAYVYDLALLLVPLLIWLKHCHLRGGHLPDIILLPLFYLLPQLAVPLQYQLRAPVVPALLLILLVRLVQLARRGNEYED